ncbi:MAG TPA: hypothetical protein VMT35_04290, partial [Ignavibacteriaceae bacterium]|nr:hypothetical protein [Ignavibacteriaceae bacterium]
MNKSELIRKTAKLAGAPEADASLFFEIFIRSAADILNPGDVVQIKDLGFLHYKIAKADGKEVLKNLKTVFPGSGWVDLIIFSESSEKIPADPQFFVVPAKYELDFAEIDAPFSLSFNKPVIQHVQKREAYFIPQSYGELVRLLESKAARLLVNAKVIKNENKENEVFISGAAAVDEQAMTFVKPGENKIKEPEKEIISAEIPEEKINKSEEPEVKHSPEEKEEEGKIKFAQEALNRENKKEITPSGEIPDEKSDQPEQELEKPAFGEIKVEKKTEPETGKTEEEMWVQESKTDIVPGEEFKDEQPETKTEEAKTGIIPEETKKEEKSSKEREIDKLLSKGSFGA